MSTPIHRFNVGEFDCTVINLVTGERPAAALFTGVPHEEIAAALRRLNLPPDTLSLSVNILIVRTPLHILLVDTGDRAGAIPGAAYLPDSLKAAGIDPGEVDLVVITHGHGDHIGGIVDTSGALNYPNARYAVWKTEWEHCASEDNLSKMDASRADFMRRNLAPIKDRIQLLDAESEIIPGITAVAAPGHTVGHIALALNSHGQSLLHIADASHHCVQIEHPEWSPHFDQSPEIATQTRRMLFERAARDRSLVLAYHYPFPGLGRVADLDGKLYWQSQQ